jgi:hypothetical protein
MTLPDHHAVTRIKVANVPSSAFVLRTRALQEDATPTEIHAARISRMIEHSRRSYCTPASAGRVAMEACHSAYIPSLRLDSSILDANSRSVLGEVGIDTMNDLLRLPAEERAAQLSKLKSSVDRARLQALMVRMA